ncbi:MAG TPA: hypothetical protein VFS95_07010 [Telluria sp.]|jgi:hypothetical protein|nr:hypothetical protein [Telluria sp.]
MMNKLLLAVAAMVASAAALAVEPTLDDSSMTPMAEDQCQHYGDCGVTNLPPPPPPKKPRQ